MMFVVCRGRLFDVCRGLGEQPHPTTVPVLRRRRGPAPGIVQGGAGREVWLGRQTVLVGAQLNRAVMTAVVWLPK